METSTIGIANYMGDNKPIIEFGNVRVTHKDPPVSGTSQRTGEPFTIVHFNVEINLGDGVKRNYMRVTAFTRLADEMARINVNDYVDLGVDLNISGSKFPVTDVRLISIKKR